MNETEAVADMESEQDVRKLEKIMRSKSAIIGKDSNKFYRNLNKSNTVVVDHYDLNHAKNSFMTLMSTLSPKTAIKSAKKSQVKRYYIRSVSPKLPDNNRVSILDRYKHSYATKDVAKIASGLQD